MKQILSLLLFCSALSINHTHAFIEPLEIELGDGVDSYNELSIVVFLDEATTNSCRSGQIKRLYTLQGDRLHACPSFNEDETTTIPLDCEDAAYTAHVKLHRLKKDAVVLDYDVFQQSIFKREPQGLLTQWPLYYVAPTIRIPTSPTTGIKTSLDTRITLNTQYQDVIKPAGTDIELMLKIKAVLTKHTHPPRVQANDDDANDDDDNTDNV